MESESLTLSTEWDRALVKRLGSLGISDETARRMTARLRGLRHLPELGRRRSLAQAWEGRADVSKLVTEGFADLTEPLKALAAPCVNALKRIAEGRLRKGVDGSRSAKSFLVEMLTPEDFDNTPEILDFILSDEVLAYSTNYLGSLPVLQIVALSWTPANENLKKSQLFHYDNIDDKQLKFSMNISDVIPENGPFTLIPKPQSEAIVAQWMAKNPGYTKGQRIPDEFIIEHVPENEWIQATGAPGTIFAVDTCRCLHLGARTRAGYRVTLRFNFTRLDCERMFGVNVSQRVLDRYAGDTVRALVLNR